MVATGCARIPNTSSQGSASKSSALTTAVAVEHASVVVAQKKSVVVVAGGDELGVTGLLCRWTKDGNESKQVAVLFVHVWLGITPCSAGPLPRERTALLTVRNSARPLKHSRRGPCAPSRPTRPECPPCMRIFSPSLVGGETSPYISPSPVSHSASSGPEAAVFSRPSSGADILLRPLWWRRIPASEYSWTCGRRRGLCFWVVWCRFQAYGRRKQRKSNAFAASSASKIQP